VLGTPGSGLEPGGERAQLVGPLGHQLRGPRDLGGRRAVLLYPQAICSRLVTISRMVTESCSAAVEICAVWAEAPDTLASMARVDSTAWPPPAWRRVKCWRRVKWTLPAVWATL